MENQIITPEQIISLAGTPVISIKRASELTGGLMADKTIHNLCSMGLAPKKIKLGRRSGMVTSEFAEWFCDRLQSA